MPRSRVYERRPISSISDTHSSPLPSRPGLIAACAVGTSAATDAATASFLRLAFMQTSPQGLDEATGSLATSGRNTGACPRNLSFFAREQSARALLSATPMIERAN